jgi:propionyl-CoA synthetase
MGAYEKTYRRSIDDPEGFWGEQAAGIDWIHRPSQMLDTSDPHRARWFPDGTMNTCFNALDRHVAAGRGDQAAIIYDSPVTDTQRTITYAQLTEQSAAFAGSLRRLGVGKGDRVVLYMPMVPEAVVAMLACARIGAVHSVVFGGFAPNELATRIDDAQPTVIVSASCGIEPTRVVEYKPLLDRALERSTHQPDFCVVLQRPQAEASMVDGRDVDWAVAMEAGRADPAECVAVAATDPLYVLYTSGTTGKPKGIVRDNGGHAVALAWSMRNVYDVSPGDVWWTASDVGWVVGHSYIVYAPLLIGATSVLFEGKPVGTPDAGAFWRVIAEHGVTALFTAPTAFRAIRKADPDAELLAEHDVPGGGEARPGHLRVGRRDPRRAGHRPLVADRDRLVDCGEPARSGADADQTGVADRARAGVGCPRPRHLRRGVPGGHRGCDLCAAAAAAGGAADAVERRRTLCGVLSRRA